ncbi:hypothetical protein CPC08DRAFT_741944 [Agrocybe pediades]|nr:hypothetical protein CPC08DRAFT_741944 [Agrocybe pediades]
MNRISPNLLYLTIYNPTLRPDVPNTDSATYLPSEEDDHDNTSRAASTTDASGSSNVNVDDDEDAEEQAHILFYTAKERAVSRDRMLRQVGLAKALVNFAELFNTTDACDSIHSQAKRLILVSPEPNFWIHAGVELAKYPRSVDPKSKSSKSATVKGKSGSASAKGKEKDISQTYDYDEGSVHDSAIRAHIMRGYERFKLTHGSFSSIHSTLGKTALELQLERFWTVWAWSWDLEEKLPFGEDLGPLLHPCFASLTPIVNEFAVSLSSPPQDHLETETEESSDSDTKSPCSLSPVVLTREHIIPSTLYSNNANCYPHALAAHLQSMIPPPRPPVDTSRSSDTLASSVDTIRGKRPLGTTVANPNDARLRERNVSKHLGGNDGASIFGINMDMKHLKWNWPGYLTFGKGNVTKPPLDKSINAPTQAPSSSAVAAAPDASAEQENVTNSEATEDDKIQVEVAADAEALEDAISSNAMSLVKEENQNSDEQGNAGIEESAQETNDDNDAGSRTISSTFSDPDKRDNLPALPEFSMTRLHLAPSRDPTSTRKVTIHYLIRDGLMVALINTEDLEREAHEENDSDDSEELHIAAEKSTKLLDDLEVAIYESNLKNVSSSLPSATKILQTQDQYLISTGHYTHISPAFTSTSSHLFNAKATLENDPEITEVFSRGQNPQHWHIAKRGLASTPQNPENETIAGAKGEYVFMEVFRKETSLTDVDNVLASVVRKSGLGGGI